MLHAGRSAVGRRNKFVGHPIEVDGDDAEKTRLLSQVILASETIDGHQIDARSQLISPATARRSSTISLVSYTLLTASIPIENCAANEPRSSSAISYQPSAFSQTVFISCAGINKIATRKSTIALAFGSDGWLHDSVESSCTTMQRRSAVHRAPVAARLKYGAQSTFQACLEARR